MNECSDLNDAQQVAEYCSWGEESSARGFMSVIMLPRLIVRKIHLDIEKLVSPRRTVFPQVTLCLEILRVKFGLVLSKKAIVLRQPGLHQETSSSSIA